VEFKDNEAEAVWRSDVRSVLSSEASPAVLQRQWFDEQEPSQDSDGFRARPGGIGAPSEESPDLARWRASLVSRGWLAPAWPREFGGAGLGVTEQFILAEELARARAPVFGGLGLSLTGPTLMRWGTPEQQTQHLPRILKGDVVWCQGFSEPDSGSDLASLQLTARKDGDDFVLTGTKIWTTSAHFAQWMMVLARTDRSAPKHRGITYFLLDMRTAGLTIQPIAAMNGTVPFCHCIFDGVRVPAENIVGEVNRGWYVATTTLDVERTMIADSITKIAAVEDMAAQFRSAPRDATVRGEIVTRRIEAGVAQLLSYRIASMQKAGLVPNHEASMAKLFHSELYQRIASTGMKLIGMNGTLFDARSERCGYVKAYLYGLVMTIAGGTSEVQRNIIATRGLGMPR
jgi:alkylation response protein AidB-like acyl-CoA dehydrogenase